jgi:hypothetical protein
MFNVTYWPYIQVSTVYDCVNYMFGDSWYNLNLNFAFNYKYMFGGLGLVVFTFGMLL